MHGSVLDCFLAPLGIATRPISRCSIKNHAASGHRNPFVRWSEKSSEKVLEYYVFSDQVFNTLEEDVAHSYIERGDVELVKKTEVKLERLDHVLDRYSIESSIDFMNIDVEGHEMEVLASNNWSKYR